VKKSTVPKLENPVAPNADDQTALRQVLDYYHARLKENPAALAYLQKRGFTNQDALATFRVGFVDRTLGLRLPQKNRREGAELRARLQRLGVIRKTGHEHFRGCVVFPVIAENGAIGTIYGRAIDAPTKDDRHIFLPGPQRGVWNPAALRSSEVIVTEGIIDALTFWCAGFRNVTTSYSAKALPEELLDALLAAKVARVLLAFDRDQAGDDGAAEVAAQLAAQGVECRRVLFPHGQDANSYALAVTPAQKSLAVLLQAAAVDAPTARRSLVASSAPARVSSSLAASVSGSEEDAAKEKKPAAPITPTTSAPVNANDERATPARQPDAAASAGAGAALLLRGAHHVLELDGREYRVTGLEKSASIEVLKVTLRVKCGERFHLDALDLCRDGERRRFAERAAEETGLTPELLKRDLGRVLLAAEQTVEARQDAEAKAGAQDAARVPELEPTERAAALAWLGAPDLVGRLRAAFRATGMIGEENNVLVAYLACVSRQLDRPLAVIVQSASAAGKTTLMEHVLAFFPEESRVKYSALTGQSLYYLGETSLRHKILAVVEEAGAEKASYALKLLQSEGELTIASTGKDPATGRMVTQEYHVEGPVMIFLTTTAIDLDEELQNRCLTLAVDESAAQTARIHTLQRERRTLPGLVAREERKELLRVLRNAQRLLRSLHVVNPFAPALTFPSERTRARRDHEKYLTLIDAIALLHQHQRPVKQQTVGGAGGRAVDYVEVTLDDIRLANELAPEVLGRSLDELPPQTRALLEHIRTLVKSNKGAAFARRELRERCGWSLTQVSVHLDRLVALEYLAVRCGRMGSQFVYDLLITEDAPLGVPLIDVAALKKYGYDQNLTGQNGHLTGGAGTGPLGVKVA
jgi:DNA primase